MIIVDTNIIAYLYLNSEHSGQAERALQKDLDWAAPLLWRSEFRSVLTLCIRKKMLSLADAQQIMNEAMSRMRGREYEVPSVRVLNLAAGCACSSYDCEFIALAEELGVPLVTVDKQILAQFPQEAVSLETYVA